ncbi:type II secretion system protein [Paenibacillus sp. BC26]|uniref:type II secretion system protein n=1 Tax=Paenibacillus sp. BC26 TaxID=1881032 RepID=UPI0008E862A7|nr:prepilin-type N-terminal cleavage/methylation domain-containing protein [Paenibacillus sp. BC26]SFT29455.1 type IV pilus assembly protein PilA [Paenibacillus sp. BC26]
MVANVLKRARENEKGFTLIELLAVIVILGVIAAIAIPLISSIISKSKTDSDIATARQIYDASRIYVTSELNGDFKTAGAIPIVGDATTPGLISKGYLSTDIILPSTKTAITDGTVTFNTSGNLTEVLISTDKTKTTDDKKYDTDDLK